MKRLGSSDSLGALISICQTTEEHSPGTNHVYDMEFQSIYEGLDEEGGLEESGQMTPKKRRLSVNQVKALEKNFEVENKLEPERKVKLAQELGLQPRQVAVWFQNRRARWKTKNLERDYGILKANYDALKHNYETIQHDNQALRKEIGDLKSKLHEENSESNLSVKEEITMSESDNKKVIEESKPPIPSLGGSDSTELNYESFENRNGLFGNSVFADLKDGSSDSDSSAILNEENNPSFKFNCSSSSSQSSINWFQFSESKSILGDTQKAFQPFVKIEEHNFFGGDGDESCNFFSEEQAPTLQWYCSDQWS